MTILNSIFTHIYLLFTLQHDGRGLPKERAGIILMFILGVVFAYWYSPPENMVSLAAANLVFSPLLAYLILGKDLFAGTMLASVLGSIEGILLRSAGLQVPSLLISIHVALMVTSLIFKQGKRIAQEKGEGR
jgi:hypothetical protein